VNPIERASDLASGELLVSQHPTRPTFKFQNP